MRRRGGETTHILPEARGKKYRSLRDGKLKNKEMKNSRTPNPGESQSVP